ncbi:MAG TPA: bifunctional methylenetetrahydrofolate dehydrogenase/methenyltetrahydrofolate cyclohydrolase FolD [Nitrospinota bacterium]|nr:bifunctional methylenetetrahydrofolate dehydrogenase/methenyltetrahydrofolate cyclohydrolase FolD [Nitrospinota bacterium]
MKNNILDGKAISTVIKKEIAAEIKSLNTKSVIQPGLAVIQVGDNPASSIYVRNKKKSCDEAGIKSFEHRLSDKTSEEELLTLIKQLNDNEGIHGILVQLPLPSHIREHVVLEAISPDKDVDGFHPYNVGKLMVGKGSLLPCTPAGIIELLERSEVKIEGKKAVILGRSNIVGKPLAIMLLQKNATVTICHSKTKNLPDITKRADILVAAIGSPEFVKEDMVKEGAVVIDVGINRVEKKLVGDVDFEKVSQKASQITPVPGGIGPMTIALLMKNGLSAFKNQMKIK